MVDIPYGRTGRFTEPESDINLSINNIPLWLQNSELYNNLKENGSDDDFTISRFYFKDNSEVSDLSEFKQVLKISSFWLINSPPDGLLHFIENFTFSNYEEFKDECKNQFSMLAEWWDIFDIIHTFDKNHYLSKFIEIDNIRMVEHYRNSDNPITFQDCIQASGVSESMLNHCLTIINIGHKPEDDYFYIDCFMNSLSKNRLDCVKYLLSVRPSIVHYWRTREDFCIKAVQSGSLECLKYLHENGFPWGKDTILCAGWKGHLNCLKYLVMNGCPFDDEVLYCCTSECYDYLHTITEMYDELSDSEDGNFHFE